MTFQLDRTAEDLGGDEQRPCARGERCAEAAVVQTGEGIVKLPALGYRTYCSSDRSHIMNAIERLPDRYLHLALILPEKGSGAEPRVSGSRTPPVPPRLDVDALMVEIVQTAWAWWERVALVARLSIPDGRERDGFAISRMCTSLTAHLDVLLGLPPEWMGRRVTVRKAADLLAAGGVSGTVRPNAGYAEVFQDRSGADAGLDFLTLDRRCKHLLGLTPQHQDLPVPCWACQERTVRRWDGAAGLADEAHCLSCGETYTHERYQLLMADVAKRQRGEHREAS